MPIEPIPVIYQILLYIGFFVLAYLIGSINNSMVIGTLFYRKDVREYGSKNAGGTNAGRVLGKKAGIIVILLDILKTLFVYWGITLLFIYTKLNTYINFDLTVHIAMVLVAVGHCFPIYYKFKGGKAVSVCAGFILASNWLLLIILIFIFVSVLLWKKMVSLASVTTAVAIVLFSFLLFIPAVRTIGFYPLASQNHFYYIGASIIMASLLIYMHRDNIKRIMAGNERTISFKK